MGVPRPRIEVLVDPVTPLLRLGAPGARCDCIEAAGNLPDELVQLRRVAEDWLRSIPANGRGGFTMRPQPHRDASAKCTGTNDGLLVGDVPVALSVNVVLLVHVTPTVPSSHWSQLVELGAHARNCSKSIGGTWSRTR